MKVLVIQLYQTGDVVLSTHIPREIRKLFPDYKIDFLTFGVNKPVLENSPYIDNILTINRGDGFIEFLSTISHIRSLKYDVVIDLHNNPRSGYITFLSGAKKRITYSLTKKRKNFFYNYLVERENGKAGQIKLSLLKPLVDNFDINNFDYKPEIFPSLESATKAKEIFKQFGITDTDFLVTMSPTHKRDSRRWKIKHFMDTAKYLTEKKHNAKKIILTYGPGEKDYITDNIHSMPENVFLMPELNMSDFIALIGQAKLHIGNDSAPHHIATAQSAPTFVVLGSSNSGWVYGSKEHSFAMLGLDCQPCGKKSSCRISDDIPCMNDLSFDMIKDDLEKFIKDNSII